VRIEQRGRGAQAEAQGIGWLSRFFINVPADLRIPRRSAADRPLAAQGAAPAGAATGPNPLPSRETRVSRESGPWPHRPSFDLLRGSDGWDGSRSSIAGAALLVAAILSAIFSGLAAAAKAPSRARPPRRRGSQAPACGNGPERAARHARGARPAAHNRVERRRSPPPGRGRRSSEGRRARAVVARQPRSFRRGAEAGIAVGVVIRASRPSSP
jgi:hypothetical protein